MDVDLDAIVRNWRGLAAKTSARVGAAVKANAYGLGVAQAAPALDRAGCRDYFVAVLSEAIELSDILSAAAPGEPLDDRRIYVLNGFTPTASGVAACDRAGPRIAPVISSLTAWRAWADVWHIQGSRPPVAALQVETGMNRLGATAAEIQALEAGDLPENAALLVMSHLASADDPDSAQNAAQRTAFDAALAQLRPKFPSLAASLSATGGELLDPALHYDLVRAGIGLYGAAPFGDADPVVELSAPILRVWDVEPGAQVGYNATWTAQTPTRLATAAIGYADGLPRALSNVGRSHVQGVPAPIVGRVSMDLTVLDVSDPRITPRVGDRAIFLAHGSNAPRELSVDAMASLADTIGYEILTRLGAAPRVARRYRGARARP